MIQGFIEKSVQLGLLDTPVVLPNGASQTGKTTPDQRVAEKTDAQFFALDDSPTRALAAGHPAGSFTTNASTILRRHVRDLARVDVFLRVKSTGKMC